MYSVRVCVYVYVFVHVYFISRSLFDQWKRFHARPRLRQRRTHVKGYECLRALWLVRSCWTWVLVIVGTLVESSSRFQSRWKMGWRKKSLVDLLSFATTNIRIIKGMGGGSEYPLCSWNNASGFFWFFQMVRYGHDSLGTLIFILGFCLYYPFPSTVYRVENGRVCVVAVYYSGGVILYSYNFNGSNA